jgi:hypothetical protein
VADADKDYYSFEEVLKDLDMEEDQLKKLVSAGEIRAFRDKNTMRFKAEDIQRLRTDGDDLELDDDLKLDDELELDLDLDLDLDEGAELELTDDEPLLDLDDTGDELVLEDDELAGSLGGQLEEVDLSAGAAAGGAAARKELRSKRKVGAEARAAAEAEEQASEGALVTGLLCVGAVVLLLACFTVFSAVAGHSNPTNGWIVNFFS